MPSRPITASLLFLLAAAAAVPLQAAQPTPNAGQLLKQVRRNQERVERARERYTFTDVEEQDDVGRDGCVKKAKVKQYDAFFLNGYLIRRLVKKDGRSLSASAQRKEDERVSKSVRKDEKRPGKKDQDDQVGIGIFLRASRFSHPRGVMRQGRGLIAFDFQPNPFFRPKTPAERVVHDLGGVMWVDGRSGEVVRLQAGFDGSYKVGAGLLGAIEKGTTVLLEQKFVDGDVWLPSLVSVHANIRVLVFKGLHLNVVDRYSDYRVFNVKALSQPASPAPPASRGAL